MDVRTAVAVAVDEPGMRRTLLRGGAAGALVACLGGATKAFAQQAPTPAVDTLRILCGFGAGGAIDIVARRVGERLQGSHAKAVVVDNRIGAGGRIAIEAAKAAPPDGSTIVLTPGAMLYLYPHIYRQLSYNPLVDLTPVTLAVNVPMAIGVGPMVPESVRSLADLVAWYKASPDKANYGTGGAGSNPHFTGVLFERAAGVDLQHIAFKGTQAAILDTMGGQIAAAVGPEADFMAHLKSGRVRLLAISGRERTKFNPQVPTFVEQGMKEIVSQEWFGFFLPPRASAEVAQRTAAAIATALRNPAVVDGLAQLGFLPNPSTPAELGARLKTDLDAWAPVVKSTGFTAE